MTHIVASDGVSGIFATPESSATLKQIADHVDLYSEKAWIKQNSRFSQWVEEIGAKLGDLLIDFLKCHLTAIIKTQLQKARADGATALMLQACTRQILTLTLASTSTCR